MADWKMQDRKDRFEELRVMMAGALARHYISLNPTYPVMDGNPPQTWSVGVLIDGILTVEFPPDIPEGRNYRFEVGDPVTLDGTPARITARTWFQGDRAAHYHITSLASLWISENTLLHAHDQECT